MSKKEKEVTEYSAWEDIEGLFGEDIVFHPEQLSHIDVIKTQSPELDRAIGIGGFPRGRLIQIAGRESAGKSFMALMAMKEWQEQDPENCCMYIDCEYTYDPDWASSLGIDNDRVFLVKTNLAQKIFSGLLGSNKKNKLTGALTKIPGFLDKIVSGDVVKYKVNNKTINLNLKKLGVIVLDSLSVLEVPAETESEIGKQNIALVARFLSAELKKLTPAIALSNVAFIAINQVRVNVGQFYGDPETTSGGKAWKHAASLMIQVAPIGGADCVLLDNFKEKIGHKLRAKVTKNKVAPPGKQAEFFINFQTGIVNTEEEILKLGCLYDLIKRPNNKTYIIGEEKIISKESTLNYIRENKKELENKIRELYLSGYKPTLNIKESEDSSSENPFDDLEDSMEEIVEEVK